MTPNVFQHIEVLRQEKQFHHIVSCGTIDMRGEIIDRFSQSIHNSFTLLCDAQSRQVLALGLGFRSLDLKNLLRFGFLGCGLP